MQYINNSTANKLINYYSNFLTAVHIARNGKNGDAHRSSKFQIGKYFLEKPSNISVVTEISDPSKYRA